MPCRPTDATGPRNPTHLPSESLARRTGRALVWKALEVSGARAVALVRTLVLARLLVPDDFGLLAIGMLTVDVAIEVTNFGMREALIQRPSPEEREYETAWTFELLRAIAVAAAIVVLAPLLAVGLFAEPRALPIIRVLALVPMVDHLRSIKEVDLHRDLRFRPLAVVSLVVALVHAAVAVALAPTLGVWALVLGVLVGVGVQTGLSFVVAPWPPVVALSRAAAAPLFTFGRWIFVQQVVTVAGGAFLQAVVARRLGAADLGLYFLATRLAFLPREVAEKVAGKVVFPVHVALQARTATAAAAFRASVSGIWAALIPVYAVAIALAPALVDALVGTRWSGAAPVIRVLAIAAVVGTFADAALPLVQGRGHTHWLAVLDGVRSLIVVALIWPLAGRFGVVGAALAWLVAETAATALAALPLTNLLERPFSGLISRVLAILVVAGAGAVVSLLLLGAVGPLAGAALGALLALALLIVVDRLAHLDILRDLSRAFPALARLVDGAPDGHAGS